MASKRRKTPSKGAANLGLLDASGHVNRAVLDSLQGIARAQDFYVNPAARTGWGSQSLPEQGRYELIRFSYDYWSLITLYRNQFLCRRIIDVPADDMMRAWPSLRSEMQPGDEDRINRSLRRTGAKRQMATALKWGRLFGGAGALIVIEGQEKELDQPLNLDDVRMGAYKGLSPFDMWAGISPSVEICTDINRPQDVNKPEYYEVRATGGESFKVHASRILRFLGPEVPTPEREAQMYWGISELEPAYEIIRMFDSLLYSVLNLTYRANLLGLKYPDLAQLLSGLGSSAQAAQRYEERLGAINHLMSNQSLIPLPADGGLESTQYSFAGLDTVFQAFQLNVCSATGIPMTRLWGRTLSGIGQTNEGDERVYEEKIATEQERVMRPALEKLYPVICMSELGEVPDDLDLEFPSIRVLDEKEKAELGKSVVDTVTVALNSGGISLRTYAKELQALGKPTGMFTNLTDEEVAKLPDEPQQEGELGAEGNMFGEEAGGEPRLDPAGSPQEVLREEGQQREEQGKQEEQLRKLKDRADEASSRMAFAKDANDKLETWEYGGATHVGVIYASGSRSQLGSAVPLKDGGWLAKVADAHLGEYDEKVDAIAAVVKRCGYGHLLGTKTSDAEAPEDTILYPTRHQAYDSDGPARMLLRRHGLDIVIENPAGSVRSGPGWEVKLGYHYGYLPGYEGADGDSVDVAVNPRSQDEDGAAWVYCFDQNKIDNPKAYDEVKCLVGYPSAKLAVDAYKANHHAWKRVLRDWTPMPVSEFKRWLKEGDLTKPVSEWKG